MTKISSLTLKRAIRKVIGKPKLSLVVIVYKMPEQAKKTLLSLSTSYQRGVFPEDYEVIVVENSSSNELGADYINTLEGNFRYFYREESLPTPVFAINFGAQKAKGSTIGIIIDGARMASPGLVYHILKARNISKNAVVAAPGYHIGDQLQQWAVGAGYDEKAEEELLASIEWPKHGYKLFDISVLSGSCSAGSLRPVCESNCFCIPRHIWKQEKGMDPRFTETGGGQANLDLYKRICERPDTELIVLPGEGTFHQYHGGVTTGGTSEEDREIVMQAHFDQYKSIRGEYYKAPQVKPTLFGDIPKEALRFLKYSASSALGKDEIAKTRPVVGLKRR